MEQHQQAASTNWFNMSFLTLQFLCLLGKGEKAKVVPIAIVLSFWHYVLPPGDMELSEISELSKLSTYAPIEAGYTEPWLSELSELSELSGSPR